LMILFAFEAAEMAAVLVKVSSACWVWEPRWWSGTKPPTKNRCVALLPRNQNPHFTV